MSTITRDKHGDRDYFAKLLEVRCQQQTNYLGRLAVEDNGGTQRRQLGYQLFNSAFSAFQAAYALGNDRRGLLPFAEAVARSAVVNAELARPIAAGAFPIGRRDMPFLEGYMDALHTLAIGVLCGLVQPMFSDLCDALNHRGEDLLLEHLMRQTPSGERDPGTLLYPAVFGPLAAAFVATSAEERAAAIRSYMKVYYRNMKSCPWHNRHLRKDAGYSGYWAWEAAAVAKLLHINEAALAGLDYYPYGLS